MTTSYIGIDLHRTVIQICVLDERGESVAEERIRYESLEEGLAALAFVRRFAPGCRVAVEALGLNRWFVNACREAGIEVLVCDARKLGLRALGKKTDVRDAREIARRLWLGDLERMARTYYPSDAEYGRRKLLRVRHRLVQMRQQAVNQLRALLNAYQLPAPRTVLYTRPSQAKLAAVKLPAAELQVAFDALRSVLERLQEQIQALARRIEKLPRTEPELGALVSALPHIGAQSAATLRAEIGDPRRFQNARAVAAYAGLVPSVAQSADHAHHQAGQPRAALDPFPVGGAPDEGRPAGSRLGREAAATRPSQQGPHGPRAPSPRRRLDPALARRGLRPAPLPRPPRLNPGDETPPRFAFQRRRTTSS